MDKLGNIEIRVRGNKGNLKLSPDNYDVKEIIAMLQNVEDLLYPTEPIICATATPWSLSDYGRKSTTPILKGANSTRFM
ncbi:MAG: hypothetical protein R6V32_00390 [Bacteroidales bacterium]